MNIAFFLIPKGDIAYLYDDFSYRQGLEKMRFHGYTSIPVLTRSGKYAGTISEGDFLWNLVDNQQDALHKIHLKDVENIKIGEILQTDKNPPVRITASMEELLIHLTNQNYIPVIDDANSFVGIVTRREILHYFYKQLNLGEARHHQAGRCGRFPYHYDSN
jgi:CBS domain-containing protein